jgi:hypothetical protein
VIVIWNGGSVKSPVFPSCISVNESTLSNECPKQSLTQNDEQQIVYFAFYF